MSSRCRFLEKGPSSVISTDNAIPHQAHTKTRYIYKALHIHLFVGHSKATLTVVLYRSSSESLLTLMSIVVMSLQHTAPPVERHEFWYSAGAL